MTASLIAGVNTSTSINGRQETVRHYFCPVATMTEKRIEFSYRNIKLYKSQSLGSGSYGGVCKAKCDGLLCAAKIMHPTLFDIRDAGAASYLRKFQEECHLLSLARHPNVVQYLGTYTDPDTKLPVLLMELCDESLTAFLERSPDLLSYHLQLNICHDIALALVYLHSNGLIHRDLTGNNVLMIAGARAKITDFGMSKLAAVNPRNTALTLCPGNVLYMPPEALDEANTYTSSLDIFSFGVLMIQIITRKFPNPTERFRILRLTEEEEVRLLVPDVERRQTHLQWIPGSHPLKPLPLECLKKTESERPSALQLSEKLSGLRDEPLYIESKQKAQTSHAVPLVQLLQQQRNSTTSEQEKGTNPHNFKGSDELPRHQLKITDAQQLQADISQECVTKTTWKQGKNAPQKMCRGAAVVQSNTAYFIPYRSCKVFSYQNFKGHEVWSALPDNPNQNCGLTVIDGLVTSVGGFNNSPTNTLLSLIGEDKNKHWSIVFPPMPTLRTMTTCITTTQALVVAGGFAGGSLDTVEVMDLKTKQWATACPLPQIIKHFSGVACGDTLYLTGGFVGVTSSKSVFSCDIHDLWQPKTLGSKIRQKFSGKTKNLNVWREIGSLPIPHATLATFRGNLLAVNGYDHYKYDTTTNTWNIISKYRNKQHRLECFAVTLSPKQLLIVGGEHNDTVEIIEDQ